MPRRALLVTQEGDAAWKDDRGGESWPGARGGARWLVLQQPEASTTILAGRPGNLPRATRRNLVWKVRVAAPLAGASLNDTRTCQTCERLPRYRRRKPFGGNHEACQTESTGGR